MTLVDLLLDPFAYSFMTRALAATLIASVVCAVLSCWLVLIGWSLMGDAVSHAVLPGVVLAYVAGAPFAIGAVIPLVGAPAAMVIAMIVALAADGIVKAAIVGIGIALIASMQIVRCNIF